LEKIGEVTVPTNCYSASLHPDKKVFVCGGEDLNVYKFDFASGEEIGEFFVFLTNDAYRFCFAELNKGHFGPVHCIRFSPDGELYASGSEDGTVRMWQTYVGRSYGLWKCSEGPGSQNGSTDIPSSPSVNGTSPNYKEVIANCKLMDEDED
jgi:serine-threonine kinase receptor-associated protein